MCKVHHVNTIYMTSEQLFSQIRSKRSFLCVGLDTDVNKIPRHLLSQDDPVFAFNRAIVDATAPYAVCYKPNMAFYEESGAKGWESFRRTVEYIRERYPDMLIIADAKRGDIGNTSKMYARAFFSENLLVGGLPQFPGKGRLRRLTKRSTGGAATRPCRC